MKIQFTRQTVLIAKDNSTHTSKLSYLKTNGKIELTAAIRTARINAGQHPAQPITTEDMATLLSKNPDIFKVIQTYQRAIDKEIKKIK